MPNTMTLIASYEAPSNVGSINFSSIPSTYTDLVLNFSTRSNSTDGADAFDTVIRFNNATTNLNFLSIRGDGSGVNANALTDRMLRTTDPSNYTASTFSNVSIYLPNYSNSSYNKSFSVDSVIENNATGSAQILIAGLWSQTTAINQLTLVPVGNFVQYSSAYLYGIVSS